MYAYRADTTVSQQLQRASGASLVGLKLCVPHYSAGGVEKGQELTPYAGPAPPKGTHRYVFILFEHPPGHDVQAMPMSQRAKFQALKWAAENAWGRLLPPPGSWQRRSECSGRE